MIRLWNLLASAEDLMADPRLRHPGHGGHGRPDAYPIPERDGPSRRELLAALAEEAAA